MKRITFFLLLCLFVSLRSTAQTQDSLIAIPNGSFENWSNGSGYSVTVIFIPLSVYSSYTYPTGWNYPTYPVNETITYSGMNVNVNTNLPLLKVSNENSGAVDGSHALKMQSFMLSDIISSTVYNLASSSLDPMLTNTVFPTVLSTGAVDIDQLLPLMTTVTSNLGSFSQFMSVFSNINLNTLIDGGIPLNGVVPGRLTGYYKYTSATSGDNGGILMLGSKYNPDTHRREVVGGGYTTALTDVSTYTPFEINYTPLSETDPSVPYVEADSLILLLFSSANTTPQQGSALFLDHLQLWTQEEDIPVDTCSAIFNLTVDDVDTTHAFLSWTYEGEPDHFQVELGLQGFQQGDGMFQLDVSDSNFSISGLLPDTWYDLYVRCVCDESLMGDWAMISFHTDTLVPPVVIIEDTCSAIFNLAVSDVDTMHATLSWTYEGEPDHFEAEYGLQGFALGNGTPVNTNSNSLFLTDLQPDSYYDVYVRCVCNEELHGEWSMTSFHTDTLVPPAVNPGDTTGGDTTGIQSFAANLLSVYPNPAHGQCVVQFAQEMPKTVRLYTIAGTLIQEVIPTKETMELILPSKGIFILSCEMKEGTVVRKIVNQ
ncbi:MAG: fibronectin type III domain-containing protein [Bacteroidales bacterium]|nr:fibronectin type III domain-containing protein [Bacteroidales bacterium]